MNSIIDNYDTKRE